jgi:hypothetical protein
MQDFNLQGGEFFVFYPSLDNENFLNFSIIKKNKDKKDEIIPFIIPIGVEESSLLNFVKLIEARHRFHLFEWPITNVKSSVTLIVGEEKIQATKVFLCT